MVVIEPSLSHLSFLLFVNLVCAPFNNLSCIQYQEVILGLINILVTYFYHTAGKAASFLLCFCGAGPGVSARVPLSDELKHRSECSSPIHRNSLSHVFPQIYGKTFPPSFSSREYT